MVGLTAPTYSDELNQGVVQKGSLRQEEAAPWTQVMEEKQFLLLEKKKKKKKKNKIGYRDVKFQELLRTNRFHFERVLQLIAY